jgi:hypothetical protein
MGAASRRASPLSVWQDPAVSPPWVHSLREEVFPASRRKRLASGQFHPGFAPPRWRSRSSIFVPATFEEVRFDRMSKVRSGQAVAGSETCATRSAVRCLYPRRCPGCWRAGCCLEWCGVVGSSRGLRGKDFPALSSAMAFDSVPSPSDGFSTLSLEKRRTIEARLSLSFSAFTN